MRKCGRMRLVSGQEKNSAEKFFEEALLQCQNSLCLSSQSGCVIVKDNQLIGKGTNSPPGNNCLEKCVKDDWPADFRSDKTCCVHAEQRAIMDALKHHSENIAGSTLYYIRKKNGQKVFAGKPYCTICSKLALDVGISEFVLWHEEGITAYDAAEYNQLSFAHPTKPSK